MTSALPSIAITDDRAILRFDPSHFADLGAYDLFLRTKSLPEQEISYDWESDSYTVSTPARFAPMLGVELTAGNRDRLPLAGHLFDYQAWAVEMALEAKRFALWFDTGLGKTASFLEFGRQVCHMTSGKVLILCPASVIAQTQAEAGHFYGDQLPIVHLTSRDDLIAWLLSGATPDMGIASYHLFVQGQIPELRHCAGVIVDESSILKTGGGTIKWNLRNSALGIEYKLSCTATPAPNEAMEYASQASFLETIKTDADILWTYFSKDKHGNWYIKPHAQAAFYRFMASWSLYLRDPARFGFKDILATLPAPELIEHRIPLTSEQRERMTAFQVANSKSMFGDDLGVLERAKFAQIARGFLYQGKGSARSVERIDSLKPQWVADTVRDEVMAGRRVLVWTTFDEEGEIIAEHLEQFALEFAVLTGKQSDTKKVELLTHFRDGWIDCLISKPSLIGYGLNLQFVTSMIFSGLDDSMERRYQAIRRAYRFGQTETVRVFTPYVAELEGAMFENVAEKERRFLAEVAAQEDHYRNALEGMRVAA